MLCSDKVQSVANEAIESLTMTLAPAQEVQRNVTTRLRPYSDMMIEYGDQHKQRVASGVQVLHRVSGLFEITTALWVDPCSTSRNRNIS